VPFNSRNKWMLKFMRADSLEIHNQMFGDQLTTVPHLIMLKGAPDRLVQKCTHVLKEDGTEAQMTDTLRESITNVQNDWCSLGQRVLLLCRKYLSEEQAVALLARGQADLETYINHESNDFCLVGIVGIIDPPREGISDVIETCRGAGIRVIMITGDYALTAAAIATDIGIFSSSNYDTIDDLKAKAAAGPPPAKQDANKKDKIKEENASLPRRMTSILLSGADLNTVSDAEWRHITQYDEVVCARITPEQKLTIVKEYQKDDNIVSVTGDGVNDAPALKCADIGIAMGSGSEVAIEAAQLVLLDSNFASILVAIENGRLVFENLRKVILYLLPAGSIGMFLEL
jgi:sodium/potassium-transporting ATPase subunit alpha